MENELLSSIREMLKEELKPIKNEIGGMKEEINTIKTDVSGMKEEVNTIKTDMNSMRLKLDETYDIVKALEHSSQINKAEHDSMVNDIAHIKGDTEAIKRDMARIEEATAHNWLDIAKLKQAR